MDEASMSEKSYWSTKVVGPEQTDPKDKHAVTKSYPGELGNTVHSCLNRVCAARDHACESGGKLPSIDRNMSHAGGCVNVSDYSDSVTSNGHLFTIIGVQRTTVDGSKGEDHDSAFTCGGKHSCVVKTGCVTTDVDTPTLSMYVKGYELIGPGGVSKNTGTGRGLCVGKEETYSLGKLAASQRKRAGRGKRTVNRVYGVLYTENGKRITSKHKRIGRGCRAYARLTYVTYLDPDTVNDASNRKTVEHVKVAADGCLLPYTVSVADALFSRDRNNHNDALTALNAGTPVLPDFAVSDMVRVDTTNVQLVNLNSVTVYEYEYDYDYLYDYPMPVYLDIDRYVVAEYGEVTGSGMMYHESAMARHFAPM